MSKVYMEYLQGCFDENDIIVINKIFDMCDVDIELYERPPYIVNAALDELVESVLLIINSDELQTLLSITKLATPIAAAVKWIWNKLKSTKVKKVSINEVKDEEANIIIQVDNVKILLDSGMSEEQLAKYLRIALVASNELVHQDANIPIVIEQNNNAVNAYYLEEFAKKKYGLEYRTIRPHSYRKYSRRKP